MNKVDKLLKKLEEDKIGARVDKMFLEMIIDLNERLTILENKQKIKEEITKISKPLIDKLMSSKK